MESLLLFRRALSSPTMCRFIPALSVPRPPVPPVLDLLVVPRPPIRLMTPAKAAGIEKSSILTRYCLRPMRYRRIRVPKAVSMVPTWPEKVIAVRQADTLIDSRPCDFIQATTLSISFAGRPKRAARAFARKVTNIGAAIMASAHRQAKLQNHLPAERTY